MRLIDWLLGRGATVTVDEDHLAALALRVAETGVAYSDMPYPTHRWTANAKLLMDAVGGPYSSITAERAFAIIGVIDRAVFDAGMKEIAAITAGQRCEEKRRQALYEAAYLAIDDYRAATGRDRKNESLQKRRAEIEAAFDAWRG